MPSLSAPVATYAARILDLRRGLKPHPCYPNVRGTIHMYVTEIHGVIRPPVRFHIVSWYIKEGTLVADAQRRQCSFSEIIHLDSVNPVSCRALDVLNYHCLNF